MLLIEHNSRKGEYSNFFGHLFVVNLNEIDANFISFVVNVLDFG